MSLDMCRGTSVPIGSNTVTNIALSPAQIYCHAAAREHLAAAMALYVEASSRVAKDNHYVIDLSQDTTTPFSAVVNCCTCGGCTDFKVGVIYKMKCYNCVHVSSLLRSAYQFINPPSLVNNLVAQACVPSDIPGVYYLVNTRNASRVGNIPSTCA
jgi:hypothetical protein